MYTEVAWVLVSSGTQVQPLIIPNPDYFPDYLSISYDYDDSNEKETKDILASASDLSTY